MLHFGEELFVTIGAAKHGYDALNMHNVFRKIHRREGDIAKEQWEELSNFAFSSSLYCSSTNSICKGRRPREIQRWR